MLRILNIVVVLLLVALVPARAIGSVTISICASGQEQAGATHHEAEAGAHGTHAGDSAHGNHDNQTQGEGSGHACSYCAAHCAGVALAVPTELSRIAAVEGADRVPFGAWSAPGYFPDLLDRPPLVS